MLICLGLGLRAIVIVDFNDDARGGYRCIEVLTGPVRRRRWSAEEKGRLVAETLEPGAGVSEAARRWQVCPQQVFGWRRERPGGHALVDFVDVTSVVLQEGGQVDEDRTEVVLMGMHPGQDTVTEPFGGDPEISAFWVPEYLYRRFFAIGSNVQVFICNGLHWLDGSRRFETMTARTATSFTRYEAVQTTKGVRIHYFYDPAHAERTWENVSSEGALQTSASIVGLVYRGELYDVKSGSPWAYKAPRYGITLGARHISVLIELPDGGPVQPDACRQFIHYRTGAQDHVQAEDFTMLAKDIAPHGCCS